MLKKSLGFKIFKTYLFFYSYFFVIWQLIVSYVRVRHMKSI